MDRWRALLVVVGLTLTVSMGVGLVTRSSTAPSASAETLDHDVSHAALTGRIEPIASNDPAVIARVLPTPIVIPAEPFRVRHFEGEICEYREPATGRPIATLRVPAEMFTQNCASFSWKHNLYRAQFVINYESPTSLATVISAPDAWRVPQSLKYTSAGGLASWQGTYSLSSGGHQLVHSVGVPGGSGDRGPQRPGVMHIVATSRSPGEPVTSAINELVGSLRFAVPPQTVAPSQGGRCGDDEWSILVPPEWFAEQNCRFLNTSSEASTALQCECLGPMSLWVVAGDQVAGDAPAGESGYRYSITHEFRADDHIGDRNYRTIRVALGDSTLIIEATRQPDHVLVGHTWSDTVAAQDAIFASLQVQASR